LGEHYPFPIINLEAGTKAGRDKIWGMRKAKTTQDEKKRILKVHTRVRKKK
jgi:hypothetical protein